MDPGTTIFLAFLGALVCCATGYGIGATRNRASQGAWLGLLLGPIGIIIILILTPLPEAVPVGPQRKCPFCAELVLTEAKVCRFCQRDLPAQSAEAPIFRSSLGE